jgi:ATP-binding cassette, subfamily B, bacterial
VRGAAWSNALSCLSVLWRHARGPMSVQYALALLAGTVPVVAAVTSRALLDGLGTGAGAARIGTLAAILATAAVLPAILGSVVVYLATRVAGRIAVATEDALFSAIGRSTGIGPFEDPKFLTRLRMAEQAAQDAPQSVANFVLTALQSGTASIGLLVAVLTVWPPMALLVILGVAANILAQGRLVRIELETAETVGETFRQRYLNQSVLTDARSVKEVRLFGLGDFFRGRMIAATRRSVDAQAFAQRRVAQYSSLLTALSGVIAGIGLVVVALRAARGGATAGDVVLFLAAATGIQGAVQSIVREGGQARSGAILFGSFRSLVESIDDDLPDGVGAPPPLTRGIELRDVWFRYAPDGDWVLRGVDLVIPAGGSLALVGANGAGKSSTVKLLCRLYDPERGAILWDGVDIRRYAAAELRRRLAVTFQDFVPYDLTARENIGVGRVDRIDDEELIHRAARRAGADRLITRLPRSWDTMLSRSFDDAEHEAGVTLSGGQWQRVALARSLAREDADLLILDEPSSGLDADAEAEIHRTLRAHRDGATSVLISHRLSTVRTADTIVVLKDGTVHEAGSHAELMVADGEYARLFTLQSAGYAAAVGAP